MARLKKETEILHDVNHPNIIEFYASWVDREKMMFIFITELMDGSLKEY